MDKDKNLTIELSGLRFYGHYGLYPVESKWITELSIDISLLLKVDVEDTFELRNTIDYGEIYTLVDLHMKSPHKLLETIANQLITKIKQLDNRIELCKVRISKTPQLGGPLERVSVQMEY